MSKPDNKIYDIIFDVRDGKLKPEEAYHEMIKNFDEVGCFTIHDIEDAYNTGRAHGKNNNILTVDDIKRAYMFANNTLRHVKFE
jgi:hypothetical protein